MLPLTSSFCDGPFVPIPTFPPSGLKKESAPCPPSINEPTLPSALTYIPQLLEGSPALINVLLF